MTRVAVALEYRFTRGPDGRVLAETHYGYPFWTRYLAVFDEVLVVARVRRADRTPTGWHAVEGRGVRVVAVPDYQGPWQYLSRHRRARRAVDDAVATADCAILRVPGQVGTLVEHAARRRRRPFAVEVVGDPADSLAPGSVQSRLADLFRALAIHHLRRQCRTAVASAFVTAHTLQRRYPPAPGRFTTHYSSVELPDEAFTAPRAAGTGPARVIFVGSLAQPYKGLDCLLAAMRRCRDAGVELQLEVLGDGALRPELERQAASLDLAGAVDFRGRLPSGAPVWDRLRAAELFVLPSYAEGLPRALIEAMAAGLPCLASAVGGVPELLDAADLVPPRRPDLLAARLAEVVGDPRLRSAMAERNFARAREYHRDVLRDRREQLYRTLRDRAARGKTAS